MSTPVLGLLFCMCAMWLAATPANAGDLPKNGDKIYLMGDSITAGATAPNGYGALVATGLKTNGISVQLIGGGVSGNTSQHMLARVDAALAKEKPDWLTLSCGVNDVWHLSRGKGWGVELEAYKTNVAAIVGKAQAAGVRVMIVTPTVVMEDLNNNDNRKMLGYLEFLKRFAQEKHCLLADANTEFRKVISDERKNDTNVLTDDGIHPGARGHLLMALAILKGFGLDANQLAKAQEACLDTKISCGLNLQGQVGVSLKQAPLLKTFAQKHGIPVEKLVQILYESGFDGGEASVASVEKALNSIPKEERGKLLLAHLEEQLRGLQGK